MSSSSPSRLSLRQSVAMVWRTLRSMRTALILLLMLAAASVAGSLIPQIPNSPERVAQYVDTHPLLGDVLPARGALRRLRVVVVHADHRPAVHLVGGVPGPPDAGGVAVPPRAADPGARDRRVPPLRGARRVARPRRGDRGRATDAAAAAVPRRARSRPPRPRRREGRPPRDGKPPLPLGVHPDPGGGRVRQGDRVQRVRARGRGRHVDRRPGELRRPDPHGPVLRR